MRPLTPLEAQSVVSILRDAGIPIMLESVRVPALRSLTRREAAELLGVSVSWLRLHEDQFPNRWRAGEDIRIPVGDLERFVERNRVVPAP